MDDFNDLKLKHFLDGTARNYVRERLRNSDIGFQHGIEYDDFGAEIEAATDTFTTFLFLFKFYFRVETHGIENIPAEGPGLLVSNHAPILPFDATMISASVVFATEHPRMLRVIVNRAIAEIPFFSTLMYRNGQIIGGEDNVRRIFENKNLVLVFPTGAEGSVHSIFNKYHLDEFTLGFMEYALRYRTPIIPTCVTGSEEAAMTLGELNLPLGGFKHLPITPIFPLLGPLGLIPFPSKFNIYFGEPVDYFSEHADEVDDPVKVRELVNDLHGRVRAMLDSALER